MIRLSILTLVLSTVVIYYIRSFKESIMDKKYAKPILVLGYLISIVLLMLPYDTDMVYLWMLGGLITAMLIDSKLGLLIHFNLSFMAGISMALKPEVIIYLLIMGVLICMLSDYLKQKSTIIYASVIILSTNITLNFVIHNFIFESSSNSDYIISLFSILLILVLGFLISQLYEKNVSRYLDKNNLPVEEMVHIEAFEEQAVVVDDIENPFIQYIPEPVYYDYGSGTSYDLLLEENNELMMKMKDFSTNLYEHALLIGDIAYRGAKEIGANELLAKAGGLYHEVGKIKGSNYMEEGLLIAYQYGFPKELKDILRQHNIKYDKPTSVEAVIVMLADNVISTIDYIEKNGDRRYTPEAIIENIFQMRMEKGTLDDSGLSIKGYKALKEFFLRELNTGVK
jgi:putative nucleotidyltransferase with HDIG domain